MGTTDPNVVEAEAQNKDPYAVPSDLPTATSSDPTGSTALDTSAKTQPVPSKMDSDIRTGSAQIGNEFVIAGGAGFAGRSE